MFGGVVDLMAMFFGSSLHGMLIGLGDGFWFGLGRSLSELGLGWWRVNLGRILCIGVWA